MKDSYTRLDILNTLALVGRRAFEAALEAGYAEDPDAVFTSDEALALQDMFASSLAFVSVLTGEPVEALTLMAQEQIARALEWEEYESFKMALFEGVKRYTDES